MDAMIQGIVAILVGVILLTALAGTIHTQTDTTGALNNVSASAKTLYNLYDLLWAVLGLVFIAGGGYRVVSSFKEKA